MGRALTHNRIRRNSPKYLHTGLHLDLWLYETFFRWGERVDDHRKKCIIIPLLCCLIFLPSFNQFHVHFVVSDVLTYQQEGYNVLGDAFGFDQWIDITLSCPSCPNGNILDRPDTAKKNMETLVSSVETFKMVASETEGAVTTYFVLNFTRVCLPDSPDTDLAFFGNRQAAIKTSKYEQGQVSHPTTASIDDPYEPSSIIRQQNGVERTHRGPIAAFQCRRLAPVFSANSSVILESLKNGTFVQNQGLPGDVPTSQLLSAVQRDPVSKTIVSAKALRVHIPLRPAIQDERESHEDMLYDQYMDALSSHLNMVPMDNGMVVSVGFSKPLVVIRWEESLLWLGCTIFVMIMFGIRITTKRQMIFEIFLGFLTVVLAATTAAGILYFFDMLVSPLILVGTVIIIDIGIDDTFLILHFLNLQKGAPRKRLSQTMAEASTGILLTTLTDVVIFGAGMFTQNGLAFAFCFFMVFGLSIDFMLQNTVYCALLLYHMEWKQKRNRQSVMNQFSLDDATETEIDEWDNGTEGPEVPNREVRLTEIDGRSKLNGIKAGIKDDELVKDEMESNNSSPATSVTGSPDISLVGSGKQTAISIRVASNDDTSEATMTMTSHWMSGEQIAKRDENSNTFLDGFLADVYVPTFRHRWCQILAGTIVVAILGMAVAGFFFATFDTVGHEDLTVAGSGQAKWRADQKLQFPNAFTHYYILLKGSRVQFSDANTQSKILKMCDKLERWEKRIPGMDVRCWLRAFQSFSGGSLPTGSDTDFVAQLRNMTKSPGYEQWRLDIMYERENVNVLTFTRLMVPVQQPQTVAEAKSLNASLSSLLSELDLPHYECLEETANARNMESGTNDLYIIGVVCLVAVAMVTSVAIINPFTVILVLMTMVTSVGGTMFIWWAAKVPLDSYVMSLGVISFGTGIDYITHITHDYNITPGNHITRLQHVMRTIGTPVVYSWLCNATILMFALQTTTFLLQIGGFMIFISSTIGFVMAMVGAPLILMLWNPPFAARKVEFGH
eukprot:TRINITY_DN480_c0_g1_i21.p1 TRINITY_DN480_c0_g1~~TRINITY_DN480_c0_g1_i21.p1  ORF type:complete len:1009 (+),score=224.70 TRINITY_DN480_c0_g1_i21:101-3127(+)